MYFCLLVPRSRFRPDTCLDRFRGQDVRSRGGCHGGCWCRLPSARHGTASQFCPGLHEQGVHCEPSEPKPGQFSNYGLTPVQDAELSEWMGGRLLLACWAKPERSGEPLALIEQAVLTRLLPPLNLASVATLWKPTVEAARRTMAVEARVWKPKR